MLYDELLADQLAKDEQPLVIGHLTTDWDSKKYIEVVNPTPENLRHLLHAGSEL